MAALDIKAPEADALLTKATKCAIKKSGAKFFKSVQKRSTDFLDLVCAESSLPEEFKDVEDVLTLENLLLLARYYSGEITKAKRKRKGVDTLHDKVMKLIDNKHQRIILDVILIHYALCAAMLDCETRAANTDCDYWANQYYECVDWDERAQAIETNIAGWDCVFESARDKDWEAFTCALKDLEEIDVR
tara:strand:- start:447 stop:1013 length:567 start_codon:yes stop_codon:yes gene_type:complete